MWVCNRFWKHVIHVRVKNIDGLNPVLVLNERALKDNVRKTRSFRSVSDVRVRAFVQQATTYIFKGFTYMLFLLASDTRRGQLASSHHVRVVLVNQQPGPRADATLSHRAWPKRNQVCSVNNRKPKCRWWTDRPPARCRPHNWKLPPIGELRHVTSHVTIW